MKTIHARPPRLGQHGVTLIELLIVIVIIGILAAIAIPSYRTYMIRTHRTEAKSALLQVQSNQERFYLDNDRYSDDVDDLGFDGGVSENGVYSLSLSTDAGWTQDYTATAAPTESGGSNDVNMSDDDECASFSITSQGERSATSPNCW